MAKEKPVKETTEDDVMATLLINDPDFQKFAAEKIKDGTAPLIDETKRAAGMGGGGAAAAKDDKGKSGGGAGAGKESTFFGKKNEGEIKGIDTEEKFKAIVKDQFGVEVDKGYDTFLNSTKKWRSDASKAAESEKKLKAVETTFKNLPPAFRAGIAAFSGGRDWKKELLSNLSKLDYNVPVENYKKEDLASHYFKSKVEDAKTKLSDKKIDQDAYDTLIETFHEASVSKFNAEKSEFDASKQAIIDRQSIQQENFKRSVDTAQSFLKQKFADFDDAKLEQAKARLDGNGLLSLFFDEDGNLKEDGLLRIALAEFGEEEISARVGDASKEAARDTALEIIEGANKQAPKGNSGGANAAGASSGTIDADTKALLEGMVPVKKEY